MLQLHISPVQRLCIALLAVGIFSSSFSPLGRAQTDQDTLQLNDHDRVNESHALNTPEEQKTARPTLDWVDSANLPPEQRATGRLSCKGAYIQP